MTSPLSPASVQWGISLTPAQVSPGQGHWRVISCEGPEEWGGRVSTFVDLVDWSGARQIGVRVRWFWADGQDFRLTEEKRGEPFAVDFVMSAGGNSYGVQVADGMPSDSLWGFGLADRKPHHVFKVRFLWSVGGATEPVLPPPTGMTREQHILAALHHQEKANEHLELVAFHLNALEDLA